MQFKLLLLVVLIGLTGCDQVSKHFSNQTKLDDKISKIDKKTSDCHRPRLMLHPPATRSDPLRV